LKGCSQCAQVRAFARFERDAGLAARGPGLATAAIPNTPGMLDAFQHWKASAGERVREVATQVWRFGDGAQTVGISMGAANATKVG